MDSIARKPVETSRPVVWEHKCQGLFVSQLFDRRTFPQPLRLFASEQDEWREMGSSRAFKVDPQGHYTGFHILDGCENEADALRAVTEYVREGELELWSEGQLIARLMAGRSAVSR